MPRVYARLLRILLKPLRRSAVMGASGAAERLYRELKIAERHDATVRRLKSAPPEPPLKLNLGCGPNVKVGWINIDLSTRAPYTIDLRRPWPFPDDSTEIVYSEHFFEHLEYPDEVRFFLGEAYRVLKPGGRLNTGIPGAEGVLMAYADKSQRERTFQQFRGKVHPAWCDTPMHSVNYFFRQGTEHKYAYDLETLVRVLEQSGFEKVARREFEAGLDSEKRRTHTLYVDGFKPLR